MTESTTEAPVACTLSAGDLRAQAGRWRALYAAAGIERTATADGIRVRFRRDAAVEAELRALVAVEVECCKWAEWSVAAGANELVLGVASSGHAIDVIHGWFPGEAAIAS